jgi:signal transduction histidine kinase
VRLRRSDLRVALAGGALAATFAFLWNDLDEAPLVAFALGATLGGYRAHPRGTALIAAGLLLGAAAAGATGAHDEWVGYVLVGAHAVFAGRWDPHWNGAGGLAALLAGSTGAAALAGIDWAPYLFFVPTAWAAGRALRERELVAAQLAQRARELEEEREAYAALSVRYERARIAAELHDIVAHAISVMVIQAGAGQRISHDPEATAETFEAIAGAARQAEQDMRRLAALLADEQSVGRTPDVTLVEELVERAAGSGLDVTLRLEGDREGLPEPIGEAAYHVVQEGLTNALRYAAGAAVHVRLSGDRAALVVEVTNAAAPEESALAGTGSGTGLRGLRERVGACGGTLEAGPTPAGGWRLAARLPRQAAVVAR